MSAISQGITDEIIFYSTDSIFAPLISLSGPAVVQWTWDDNTTNNTLNPEKKFGTIGLRENLLKVTPWEALDMINLGYDAGDGGFTDIPFVKNQKVSEVANLSLVAPYLRLWCSSYNYIKTLDFSNFVNLERIECYLADSLNSVTLKNTPKLWRACFEDNSLQSLDLSGCTALVDIRGALNNYTDISFSESTEELNHICVRDNNLTNSSLFSDNRRFPMIRELYIWNTNQSGLLKIPSTSPHNVEIIAYRNNYTTLDLRGSLRSKSANGHVNLSNNKLTAVIIDSCIQLTELYLVNNKLDSADVDTILKKLDSFGKYNGIVDLTLNEPPSYKGLQWKRSLEKRSWQVRVDTGTFIPTGIGKVTSEGEVIRLYPNPVSQLLTISFENEPGGGGTISLVDLNGCPVKQMMIPKQSGSNFIMDVRFVPSGMYFLKLVTGTGTLVRILAIIH